MARTKERNTKIELIRIIACFLVIVQHIMIVPTDGNGVLYTGTVTLVALTYLDVPLFLIISGFLMFQSLEQGGVDKLWPNYKHKLKNLLIYVFIPSCIIVMISGFVGPYLNGEISLTQLLTEKNMHPEYMALYIFRQQTTSIFGIFWYIWTYIKIVLFFPLLAAICQDTKDKNSIRRFLMLLSGLNILYTDFQIATGKGVGNFDNYTFDKYFLYVLLGYEIYLFTKRADIKKIRAWGATIFCSAFAGGLVIEHICFYWHGVKFVPVVSTILSSVGLFMLLYTLRTPKFSKVLNYLGKSTLYIYMVHIIVLFCGRKLWGDFFMNLFGGGSNVLWLILYDIVYGAVIFTLSLAVGTVFKLVYENIIVKQLGKLCVVISRKRKGCNEK